MKFFSGYMACLLVLLLCSVAGAQQGAVCGNPFVNPRGFGPFDYLDPLEHANPAHIPMLEKHHFNANVRAGRKGMTGHILGDLGFILSGCPNHHPALNVLLRHHIRYKPTVPVAQSPGCYLDRAIRFRPDDGTVRLLAGIYYARTGDNDKALEAYTEGLRLIPDSIELHYNTGLLYAKLGRLSEANEHAVRAYTLGAQLPGLKRKLVDLDAWNPDIVEAPVDAAAEDRS